MSRVLIYLLRRDLRLADNPVFHEVARLNSQSKQPFTHLLPVYVFPAAQIETSGFLEDGYKTPYKEARSAVGGFWRCGRTRSKFIAESLWDLKKDLGDVGSGLEIRVGTLRDAVRSILDGFRDQKGVEVHGLWMTSEEGWEEKQEEKQVERLMDENECEFKLWTDEKYFIDDRDVPEKDIRDLSDVFTSYRKTVEPLREAPRKQLPKPDRLPPLPDDIPPQAPPFRIPNTLDEIIGALHRPIQLDHGFPDMPTFPDNVESAHPFTGGSKSAQERVRHLINSGAMTTYKDTRNGLLGLDFATKLAGWLSLGCISARQVHWMMMDFENGKGDVGKNAEGYGKGENKGTAGVRFELLWRDYMRLCTRKFGSRLFFVEGYRGDKDATWKYISSPYSSSTEKKNKKGANDDDTRRALLRFLQGRTGTGLIDASQRELFLTGWTSNRARQNVASFLSKHLGIDWRLGAEWYEANLVDYDVSSNWGNWQYVAGVGNDPRGDARVFNPVKQAMDYDTNGEYVRAWVPELRHVGRSGRGGQMADGYIDGEPRGSREQHDDPEALMGVFQAWRIPEEEKRSLGLAGVEWVEHPLKRIDFSVNRRGGGSKRGRGGGGGGGNHRGRGGGGGNSGRGRGRGNDGRSQRSGPMEKAGWQ